ncbi:MAG TPA: hypothetical protein VL137_00685 [Polyangiaceae bacterium]|nr:hypothetical protein [Polyangiaceae bacterium]
MITANSRQISLVALSAGLTASSLIACSVGEPGSNQRVASSPRAALSQALSADAGDAAVADAGDAATLSDAGSISDAGDAGIVFTGTPFTINGFNNNTTWFASLTTPDHHSLLATSLVPVAGVSNINPEGNNDLYVGTNELYRISMSIKAPTDPQSLAGLRFIELVIAGTAGTESMTSVGLSTSTTLGQGFSNFIPLTGLVTFADANTYKTVDIPLSSFTLSNPDAGMADAAPPAADAGDGGVLTGLAAVQQVEIRLAPTGGSKVWRIDDISATNVPVGECKVAADCNDNNACTTESCTIGLNGGVCHHANVAADTVCRAAVAGGCDVAEVCPGGGAACPADAFEASGTACGSATMSECDMADSCSGTSAMCNVNHVAAGTACATGTCGANGTCVAPPPPAAGGTGGMPAAGGTGGTGGTPVAAGGTAPVAMGGTGGTPVVAEGGTGGTVVDGGTAGATTAAAPAAGDSGGCGCSLPGRSQSTNPANAAIGLSLLGWVLARRRRHLIG